MDSVEKKFLKLGAENAPGQEGRQNNDEIKLSGNKIPGKKVDFSHGDVDAFEPIPGSLDHFIEGVQIGGKQAYTEYRGSEEIREMTAEKLADFTSSKINPEKNLIITPGTQGALFLAMGSTISRNDKVAIVAPDYFANRKLVEFFEGEVVYISMDYLHSNSGAGLDLGQLEEAFKAGVKLFLFSNPNNPAGVIYSPDEIRKIAELAQSYGVQVVVDQLYSRQIFDGINYTHLAAQNILDSENLVTIMGPSKTESLSGYRLGVAFGSSKIINRMEKLQAIVSLRAGGYNQAVLKSWFHEPEGWMAQRIAQHQAIRDDLVTKLRYIKGVKVRSTEAGSYLFPRVPELTVSMEEFVKILRIQANVIVTPGTEFGPEFTSSFRMNFSQDHSAAVEAIDRIEKVVEEYRK
ncbi:pyridoxal phosphate-dependent aminotransferase [Oceanobacillus jeddahense]|uniref:Pyridoxal phosphate-dependent aminotransferase n=1 Tax=Oceanobacillus jeddahense TaxID=1462527 RepID=A0ABY5JYN9_9BACI|nr:pyridoxal phosphate-dependent aminotransferase [Oceanobacillus jeddahense]UUI04542.1 pyridoxal phosphate-dependent aminotransferase [Oceanobacillus jeddahense]